MPISHERFDELLEGYKQPDDLLGRDGPLQQLTRDSLERALDGRLTHHLGYREHFGKELLEWTDFL